MLKLITCLIFIPAIHGRYERNAEGRIRDYILTHPNLHLTDRPVLHANKSVHIEIKTDFYALIDLNEKDQTLTTASWLTLTWMDERLVWDPEEFDGVRSIVIFNKDVWVPRIMLGNAVSTDALDVVKEDRGTIWLMYNGKLVLGTSVVQSIQCHMMIRYFPFDTQICAYYFVPENQEVDKLNLTSSEVSYPSTLLSSEWEHINTTILNELYPFENYLDDEDALLVSFATIHVILKRDPRYYITTLIIPSTLLCLMSFATFLAPPESGERISLGVSMVLGLTVFQLLVANTLPASKNPPILSEYLTTTFIISCLAVPFSLFNINIAYGERRIGMLKYPFVNHLILDVLPKILGVLTYEERAYSGNMNQGMSQILNDGGLIRVTTIETSPVLNKVQPLTPGYVTKKLTHKEKVQLEARTASLVMDRLVLLLFLLAYFIVAISVVIKFSGNKTSV
ncbi:acetylcholine receptor subunit alpha-type unc-38-like [Apostichopus japonicus]|uniref:acetylcholine receptor subunit alpha-type unc-38-like n=1 Tax=Stichopus japonicus TaxID=307972 RepID=UPI003AB4BF84